MSKVGETLTKEQSKAGWKRLTAKQQRFLDNFMYRDMTQTASAREAGYSNPTVDAVRLLRNPVVQERYQEMRMEANARFGVEKLEEFKKLAQGRMRNVTPAKDVRVEIVENSEELGDSGK
jgi:phage terminase small subunit